jgi:catechol 2,3-dioxygenase-like lactoylglutathione lyase family enzyme
MKHLLQKACPILPAADVAATLAWYRDKLGFTIGGDHGDYGIVHRDGVELHFWKCADRDLAEQSAAYLRVADAAAVRSTMLEAAAGGRISKVEDKPWHMREFHVVDPNGNLLRFGQHAEGTSPRAVA